MRACVLKAACFPSGCKAHLSNPAGREEPSLACVSVMAGAKRRQEEERGMMITPKNSTSKVPMVSPEPTGRIIQSNSLNWMDLPGSWVHIETSGKYAEQERPNCNQMEVGGMLQGRTEAAYCECQLGVGSAHSSDEAWKVNNNRHCGAKGLTGQGTRGGER